MSKKQGHHDGACPSCTFDEFTATLDALPLAEQMTMLLEAWFGRYANETFITHKLMALTADCAQSYLNAQSLRARNGHAMRTRKATARAH